MAGSLYDSSLTFVDTRRVEVVAEIELGQPAVGLAYAPGGGSRCVVGGPEGVSVVQLDPVPGRLSTVAVEHPVWRLAVGGDPFLVVAVERVDEHQTALAAWRGDDLTTWSPAQPLGTTAAFTVEVDAPRERVVLGGRRGKGGFDGRGDRFSGALRLSDNGVTRIWNGEGLPFAPDGYLYPLEEGRLGVYGRDELVVLDLPDDDGEPSHIVGRSPLAGAVGVAMSPGGKYLAWQREATITVCPRGDTTDLRTIQMPDQPVDVGEFLSLAVDDGGLVTVAAGAHPGRIRIFTADDGELTFRGEVTVPHEPLD